MPLPLLRWRGLTLQLFLFTVLPLTVLLLAVSFGSQALHHQAMRALVGDRDLRAVRAAASALSHAYQERFTALELAAAQMDGLPDPAWLESAAAQRGFDGGLALFDASGTLLARSPGAALEALPSAGQFQTAAGDWLILFRAAAANGAALAGAVSPSALAQDALAPLGSNAATILLFSAQGDLLYGSGMFNPSAPIAERPGALDALRGDFGVNYSATHPGMAGMEGMDHSEHNAEHVIAFAPVQPAGWGLVLEEPWEETASPLLRASQSAPLVLAPVLVLAVLALWFGARQIIQPLQALEGRAGRLAAGDFSAIRAPVGGINEIQGLQGALVNMSDALQEAQNALHGYIGALTEGVENERRGLARELHDDTLQALIALNQHVQLAMLRTADPAQQQALGDLQTRITQTIASLRRAIGGLRPIYLEDLGLVAALGMLAQETSAAHDLPVRFDLRGTERRLPPAVELAFYRITQEALNNAAHHAAARSAQVELALSETSARLTIRDDGKGFSVPADPTAFARLGHFGLLGMHERADLAGAHLVIESAPGQGACVQVTLAG